MSTVAVIVWVVKQKTQKWRWMKSDITKGLWSKMAIYSSLCIPSSHHLLISLLRHSKVSAALLLAVVVKLALPVHHVGGPAVELHFPLTLRLIYVVCVKRGTMLFISLYMKNHSFWLLHLICAGICDFEFWNQKKICPLQLIVGLAL